MNRFDLVVFDLDGTLVDSRRDLADSVNTLLAERGADPLSEERIGAMVGDGAKQLVERAMAAAALDAPIGPALARFLEIYDERLVVHTRPYEGVPRLLDDIGARGIKRAVLTNKPEEAAARVLAALALRGRFDAGVAGAEGAHPHKPDPAGLIALATAASVPMARTLLVGDASQDVETARRAGAGVCVARYGFGFPTAASILDGSEILIDSPAELLAHL